MEMASDGKQIIENRARSLWDEAVYGYSHAVYSYSHAVYGCSHAVCSYSHAVYGYSHAVYGYSHAVCSYSHAVCSYSQAVYSYSHAEIEQHRCFPYKQNKGCGEAKKSGVIFRIIKCTVLQYISYILM